MAEVLAPEEAHEAYLREVALLESEARTHSATRDPESRFFGVPHDDFQALLLALRDEIEARAYLAIVAAAEGLLQLDLRARARGKARVLLGHFARAALRRPRRVELDELLDEWRGVSAVHKAAVSQFKQQLPFRHWLAHGRYFAARPSVPPDPNFAWARARALIDELRRVDPGFPRGQ